MSNPKFQHRHYAAIADVLADARKHGFQGIGPNITDQVLYELESAFVSMFKGDNARFSADRFRRAARRAPDMHGKDKVR